MNDRFAQTVSPRCPSRPPTDRSLNDRRIARSRVKLTPARLLGALVPLACLLASGAPVASAETVTKTFTVGEDQTFTVPASIVGLHVKAVGAQGERAQAPCCGTEGYGGRGARVTGNLSVTPGHTLYVEVEVGGGSGSKNGGWGGGDSDVRTAPLSAGLSPDDRLIVAGGGGGGGGGGGREAYGGGGGNAGEPGGPGVQPPDPNNPESKEGSNEGGGAGTGTKGGAGGSGCEDFEFSLEGKAGSLGHGGSGGEGLSGGGGGGAGYYGGGGGGGACAFSDLTVVGGGGGGGGGSSLVPAGGELFLAAESEAPQVQISYTTPKVTTDAASSVTPTYATLNATVNPEGVNVTDCHFEYGTSMSYGANVPCSPLPGSGTSPVAVSAVASGLSPSTTYHFRAVATNRFATTVGADHTVTTAALPTPASAAAVRCVAKPGTGKYVDDNCLAHAHVKPEEKQFELENGLTKPGLTASAGPSVLETESGTRIECTGSSATGKWDVDLNSKGQPTPVKEAESIFATFTGCTLGKAKGNCQTAGASTGEIRTGELQGTLGFLSKSGHKAGFELAPTVKKGKFAEFNCEGFGMILLGEGTGKLGDCAIAEIVGPVNLMTTTSSELYTGIKGPEGEEQTPQHFEGKTTHCNVESKIGAGGWERNVFRFEWTVGYEEALEIRA